MREFITVAKALSDETRVRTMLALQGGELCLCQIVELIGLSPSNISKHLDVLVTAGLVKRRKHGRWHYFGLADKEAPPVSRRALRWALGSLDGDSKAVWDVGKLERIRREDPREFCGCYRN